MASTRRLAAILAADAAGYSRLMGADEEGTHERLKAHLRQLIDPKIEEHRGGTLGSTRRPRRDLRFPDGARPHPRQAALPFEDRGEQSVKNIARPVRVYELRPEAVADLPVAGVPPAAPRRRRSAVGAIAAAAAAVLVIAVSAWWLWPATKSSPTAPVAVAVTATSVTQPLVAPRLSIVVLPFANLRDDRDQQYFADGITEDLTTDLSRLAHMLVISRNTAFTYRNKLVDAKQIGRELGVRYVLEGSVRRSGNQLRVNTQLIDAETDAHLWAERFDRELSDLFAVQNEITRRIAVALNLEVVGAEAARGTEHPDAQDYVLRGRAAMNKPSTRESYAEAIGLFENALLLDPSSVDAQSLLATMLASRVLDFGGSSADDDTKRAEELARKAVAASPRNALAHYAKGEVLRVQRRCEQAIPEYETALAINPNWVGALAVIGRCKIYIGPIDEAIPAQEQAIRLSPRHRRIAVWYFRIGEAHLLQSRIDDAILWLEKARNANAGLWYIHRHLASAYALKGETERATAELAEARRLSGDSQPWSIARFRANTRYETSSIRALCEATFYAGLRKARVPDE